MTRIFLCGDVMTARGIDQILAWSCPPTLHEPWVRDARRYVTLAEERNGPVPRGVAPDYPWGDALAVLDAWAPDARVANVETSFTTSDDFQPKGIHYRTHPRNVGVLTAARLDVCELANNHVLDLGREGLRETLATLRAAGLRTCGAGRDRAEAWAPAVVEVPEGRVVVYAVAEEESGTPEGWAAQAGRSGVAWIPAPTAVQAERLVAAVARDRHPGDRVIVSVHWGGNWGYDVPDAWRDFAHRLIDGGVDVVFGHSSHHPRPVELYRGRPILYGAGDFLNDYEGISGHEGYRGDLVGAWFLDLGATGAPAGLSMVPFRTRRLRLEAASEADRGWLAARMAEVCAPFGTAVRDVAGALVFTARGHAAPGGA